MIDIRLELRNHRQVTLFVVNRKADCKIQVDADLAVKVLTEKTLRDRVLAVRETSRLHNRLFFLHDGRWRGSCDKSGESEEEWYERKPG